MNSQLELPDQALFLDKLLQVASLGYVSGVVIFTGLLIAQPSWTRGIQIGLLILAGALTTYARRRRSARAREWLLGSMLLVVAFLDFSTSEPTVMLTALGYAAIIVIAALTATRLQTWGWFVGCVAAQTLVTWGRDFMPQASLPETLQPVLIYGAPPFALLAITLSAYVLTDFMRAVYARNAAAHASLLESSRQLSYQASLLDKVSDAIIAVDAAFMIRSWNAAAEAIYGWSAAEVAGQSVAELLNTRYVNVEEAANARQKLLDEGWWQGEVIQAGRMRPNIAILSSVTLIRDEQGRPNGAIAVNRDISDYKEAAEAVRVGEARYEKLFLAAQRQTRELQLLGEVVQRLVRELDLPAILRSTVQAIHEAFGYPLIALYLKEGDNLALQHAIGYAAWPERVAAGAGVAQQAALREEALLIEPGADAHEMAGLTPGATAAMATPLQDEGRVVGVLSVEGTAETPLDNRDLQLLQAVGEHLNLALQKARLYTSLQSSERRFRTLIENSSDIISIVGRDGTVLYTTPAIGRILGYAPDEHVGTNSFDIIHPDDLPANLARLAHLSSQPGGVLRATVRIRHKDGSWRWLEGLAANFFDDPAIGGIVTNFRDISERHRAEEALAQAEKLRSLGIMSGGIAHDYNNLLTVIMTQLTLAQNLLGDHPALGHLAKVRQAADRAAQLTDQLLAYSGRAQRETQTFDLNTVITEHVSLLSDGLPSTIRLTTELAADLPPLEGDIAQLQQALTNLVRNASEALGDQPGVITVSTGVHDVADDAGYLSLYTNTSLQAGRYVTLTVADNGPGMTAAIQPHIFDPFYTTKFTGRGLGLPVVVGIVRVWNGGLRVDSRPGQGAVFTLYLPASSGQAAKTPAPSPAVKEQLAAGVVLVIDDEEPVREAVADLLGLEGISVLVAVGGQEGIDIVQRQPEAIRVVLLDLSMPGLSGEQTLERLQAIRPNLPIIPMSGYSETQVRTRVKGGQIAGFLAKPFPADELLALVRRFL